MSQATPDPVRVTVEIESTVETISGKVSVDGAPASAFYGWLELIDKLERAASGRIAGVAPNGGTTTG